MSNSGVRNLSASVQTSTPGTQQRPVGCLYLCVGLLVKSVMDYSVPKLQTTVVRNAAHLPHDLLCLCGGGEPIWTVI